MDDHEHRGAEARPATGDPSPGRAQATAWAEAARTDPAGAGPVAGAGAEGAPSVGAGNVGGLEPLDLLLSPPELARRLRAILLDASGGPEALLDAYLYAVALQQVAEDRAGALVVLARELGPGSGAGRAVRAADAIAARVGALAPAARSRRRAVAGLAGASVELAHGVLSGAALTSQPLRERLLGAAASLGSADAWHDGDLLRAPSSFRSFDQRPEDAAELARRVDDWLGGAVGAPVTVVGVRTSGSYLAPLVAAALERLGRDDVAVATTRPGWPASPALRAALGRHRDETACAVLVDDPPTSGATLARAACELRRRAERGRVVVAVALLPDGGEALRERLGGTPLVALEWQCWDVHRLLEPIAVAKTLSELLGEAASVCGIEHLGPALPLAGGAAARRHVRADYRVEMLEPSGERREALLRVEGIGLGFFGRQRLEPARRAPGLFPPVLGTSDGMLLRWLLPGELAGRRAARTAGGREVVAHLAERREALAVATDRSRGLAGRQPVWEVAGRLIGRSLGPAAPVHGLFVDPVLRRHAAPARPSLVDGDVTWDGFAGGAGGAPALRTAFGEGSSGHHDLACYDALFDLAALALPAGDALDGDAPAGDAPAGDALDGDVERVLAEAWQERTGEVPAPERWLVHLLVQCWNAERLGRVGHRRAASMQAAVTRRYLARRLLDDLPPADGPVWCALDLDGVLETSPLGFPATTRAGILALRALRAHGHPVMFVTGRSLVDLERRCADYGATGGVAEYGAVAYDHGRRRRQELAAPLGASGAGAALGALAVAARESSDLEVDDDYRYVVRVAQRGAPRGAGGLPAARVAELRARARARHADGADGEPAAIAGEEQTDFVPAGVDKGSGVAALLSLLPPAARPTRIGLAVGDAPGDAPFLALAETPYAPRNADRLLEAAVPRTRRAYQSGLFEAVGRFVGHAPGSCARCRPPALGRAAEDVLALLSVQEGGLAAAPRHLAGVAGRAVTALLAERRER